MARIRTIKPEFWSTPGIETLDFKWRLLFIAMWQLADDTGRGVCNPREFLGFCFPADYTVDSAVITAGLAELRRVFGVVFYSVAGRHYFEIPSWSKHQKVDRRYLSSKFPSADEGVEFDPLELLPRPADNNIPAVNPAGSAVAPCDPGAGTGEQGNRGTGEGGIGSSYVTTARVKREAPPSDFDAEDDAAVAAVASLPVKNKSIKQSADGDNPSDWSTADDPRCRDHAGWDRDKIPPCRGCANARRWFESQAEREKQHVKAEIEACSWCDERGMAMADTPEGRRVVIRCNHRTPPNSQNLAPLTDFKPKSDPEVRKQTLAALWGS